MDECLVDEIVSEVLKRLSGKAKCLLLGTKKQDIEMGYSPEYEIVWIDNSIDYSTDNLSRLVNSAKIIVLTELSVASLARIAFGAYQTPVEEAVMIGMLMGKEIILSENAVNYRTYRTTASKNLYRRILEYEEILQSYGIQFQSKPNPEKQEAIAERRSLTEKTHQSGTKKRLILEKDLMNLDHSRPYVLEIPKDSIITPMAADYARAHQIEFCKR